MLLDVCFSACHFTNIMAPQSFSPSFHLTPFAIDAFWLFMGRSREPNPMRLPTPAISPISKRTEQHSSIAPHISLMPLHPFFLLHHRLDVAGNVYYSSSCDGDSGAFCSEGQVLRLRINKQMAVAYSQGLIDRRLICNEQPLSNDFHDNTSFCVYLTSIQIILVVLTL